MSHQNLYSQEAIEKLKELSERARICMFITRLKDTTPFPSRPMSLQECDTEGNLWFISDKESSKNDDIENQSTVMLQFLNNDKQEYLSITGEASIYTDKSTIEDKWSPMANAWFDGKDDPNVSIIKVKPTNIQYWETKDGKFVSMLKFFTAAVTGQKADNSDGREGELKI